MGNAVTAAIVGEVFGVPTRDRQLVGLRTVGEFAGDDLVDQRRARQRWLANGFPANFPVVTLIDAKIDATKQLIAAAGRQDLEAIPAIYRTMQRIDLDYAHASSDNPKLCST